MGKRLLAGFLTMCLLLGGCSADRGSSALLVDESSRDAYCDLLDHKQWTSDGCTNICSVELGS